MNAKLKFPVLGYIDIRLIKKNDTKWLAELIETDLRIELFDSEFVLE